jgi:hypothetical protein
MEWDTNNPLAKIKDESVKANRALNDYALMGPRRTLVSLLARYTSDDNQPTAHLETLKNWSRRHHWQARVARWQDIEHEQRQSAERLKWLERQVQVREESFELAQALQSRAREMLQWPLSRDRVVTRQVKTPGGTIYEEAVIKEPARWSASDIAKFADVAVKLGRLATGLPDSVSQVDIAVTAEDLAKMSDEELEALRQQIAS